MTTTITGVFPNSFNAATAIDALHAAGFGTDDISILASDSTSEHAFAVKTGSKIGEGAAIGAGVGGALAALVVGLSAVGVVASGGIGLVAAGPLVAALAGAGAGATAGGLVGALVGLGIPEHEAKYYDGVVKRGGVLIGVQAEDDEHKDVARNILKQHGAETISHA